ncbi:hypothetical protein QBC37DRAFT_198254 [Rhypophila decipiens]|uniref:Uncharacterized protein n=1 Tax=Rhypophila decipiens TaxID=261697 RepID=A0AAN6YIH7_9PEZI|nr:hypothetical protein QBC37DRAFT_198254 [Rhypophila decipiens]
MTKRALEAASPSPAPERPTLKKNDRSHEENQERAYIAASRRADRSLEARVQSARMASEIHKKRTGKGLKITEEIVLREEMYEEEDDEFPRHMRAYAGQLQATGADMNSRVNAYVTSQLAVANLARYQEVDRQFHEIYGSVPSHAQGAQPGQFQGAQPGQFQGAQPGQFQADFQHMYAYHPQDPGQQPQSFQFSGHPLNRERTQSVPNALAPPSSSYPTYGTYHRRPSHGRLPSQRRRSSTRHSSFDAETSTTDSITPGSITSTTTPITSFSGEEEREKEFSSLPVDPSLTISTLPDEHTTSSFTSDLSSETKALFGAYNGVDHRLMVHLNTGELIGSDNYYAEPHDSPFHTFTQIPETVSKQEVPPNSFNIQEYQPQDSRIASLAQAESGTPNVDFAEWITDTPNF